MADLESFLERRGYPTDLESLKSLLSFQKKHDGTHPQEGPEDKKGDDQKAKDEKEALRKNQARTNKLADDLANFMCEDKDDFDGPCCEEA